MSKASGRFPIWKPTTEDRVWFNSEPKILWRRNFQSPPLLVFGFVFFFNKDQTDFYFIFQHKIVFPPSAPRASSSTMVNQDNCWQEQSHHKGPGHDEQAGRYNMEYAVLVGLLQDIYVP